MYFSDVSCPKLWFTIWWLGWKTNKQTTNKQTTWVNCPWAAFSAVAIWGLYEGKRAYLAMFRREIFCILSDTRGKDLACVWEKKLASRENHHHHHLRTWKLEGALWMIKSSPYQGGTVGNRTPKLWLHSQMPESLSYLAVSRSPFPTLYGFGRRVDKKHWPSLQACRVWRRIISICCWNLNSLAGWMDGTSMSLFNMCLST